MTQPSPTRQIPKPQQLLFVRSLLGNDSFEQYLAQGRLIKVFWPGLAHANPQCITFDPVNPVCGSIKVYRLRLSKVDLARLFLRIDPTIAVEGLHTSRGIKVPGRFV